MPVGGQSVGVGGPKGGIGHTGTLVSAPFAREKPPSPSGCHRSRKSGGGEASRPKASIGWCREGGVGGQRRHLASRS